MTPKAIYYFGILCIALTMGCGKATDPEYVIEESVVTTPAGTEHVQVFVPASTFTMGSSDGPTNERPPHEVMLDAFYIDKYEVTNAQYLAYVEATGSEEPQYFRVEGFGQPDQPAVGGFVVSGAGLLPVGGFAIAERSAVGVVRCGYGWARVSLGG